MDDDDKTAAARRLEMKRRRDRWKDAVHVDRRLTQSAKNVASRLAKGLNTETGICWRSAATLAWEIGRCDRTVKYAIAALKRFGWIRRLSSVQAKAMLTAAGVSWRGAAGSKDDPSQALFVLVGVNDQAELALEGGATDCTPGCNGLHPPGCNGLHPYSSGYGAGGGGGAGARAAPAGARDQAFKVSEDAETFAAELARLARADIAPSASWWVHAPAALVQGYLDNGLSIEEMRRIAEGEMRRVHRKRDYVVATAGYFATLFDRAVDKRESHARQKRLEGEVGPRGVKNLRDLGLREAQASIEHAVTARRPARATNGVEKFALAIGPAFASLDMSELWPLFERYQRGEVSDAELAEIRASGETESIKLA